MSCVIEPDCGYGLDERGSLYTTFEIASIDWNLLRRATEFSVTWALSDRTPVPFHVRCVSVPARPLTVIVRVWLTHADRASRTSEPVRNVWKLIESVADALYEDCAAPPA